MKESFDEQDDNNQNSETKILSFVGVIWEALSNDNTITCMRMDKEIYYTIRIQKIHYGNEESVLVFMQDTTALQLLSEKETKARLTTMYSANVSHEMRTPLSTCINFTELLLASEFS